jgi:hypothetical protein
MQQAKAVFFTILVRALLGTSFPIIKIGLKKPSISLPFGFGVFRKEDTWRAERIMQKKLLPWAALFFKRDSCESLNAFLLN